MCLVLPNNTIYSINVFSKLLKAFEHLSNIDVQMQKMIKETKETPALKHSYVRSEKKSIYFACFGYFITLIMDMYFTGEVSCLADIHGVCKNTGFDGLKTAVLMGVYAFLHQIGVVGFLILIQHLMLDIKVRIEKVQECLLALTNYVEHDSGSIGNIFVRGNSLKVQLKNACIHVTTLSAILLNVI